MSRSTYVIVGPPIALFNTMASATTGLCHSSPSPGLVSIVASVTIYIGYHCHISGRLFQRVGVLWTAVWRETTMTK